MQTDMHFTSSAPDSTVAQIKSEAHAIEVSILAADLKQAYIAKALGVSPAYLTLIKKGERKVPERLVTPFCVLVGSMLLKQYRELQAALRAMRGQGEGDVNQRLANELRSTR
jgi:hypothetical protein